MERLRAEWKWKDEKTEGKKFWNESQKKFEIKARRVNVSWIYIMLGTILPRGFIYKLVVHFFGRSSESPFCLLQ